MRYLQNMYKVLRNYIQEAKGKQVILNRSIYKDKEKEIEKLKSDAYNQGVKDGIREHTLNK